MAEQVGKFLTELPELETPTDGDLMYIVDDETTSKKVTMANLKRVLGGNVTGTVEGASVSFSDGADGIPMEECEVTLVPTQDLHGYSKPWAGGAGKNKLQVTATSQTINGVTFTVNEDGTVLVNGTASGITIFTINNISNLGLTDGTQYILSGCSGGSSNTYKLDILKDNGSPEVINYNGDTTFTKEAILNKEIRIIVYSGVTVNNIVFKPMIRLATETDATFAPYTNICPISGHTDVTVTVASTSGGSGDDTTVSLGRTVYGGTLDVTTGVLTVTHAIVNLGSLSWTRTTDYTNPIFYAQITDKMNSSIDSICDWYANGGLITGPTTINALQNGYFGCGNNSKYIYVRDDQYASVSDFTSATASVKFYYELATPQTFTLTKEQIQTLLGQNYVSHDGGGNIKVVYIRDLDIVINDLIDRVTALENE